MDVVFDSAVQAYLDVAAEQVAIETDELDALVAARLGLDPDDPDTVSLLDEVDEDLLVDDRSAVTMLPPDVVVHAPALMAGAVLTHRLSASERAEGFLPVDTDLAGFRRNPEPHLDGHPLDVADDGTAWTGPPGWLGGFAVGALLAVRVTGDGAVTVSVLDDDPAVAPGLVDLVRASYDDELDEPGLPVSAEDLLLGVRFRDRAAFAQPGPPLDELAAAAGLERRGHQFAHDEEVWEREAMSHRLIRIMERAPGVSAITAMRALPLLEGRDPAGLRHALDLLMDPDALLAVVEELVGQDESPEQVAALAATADRLVAAAGRSLRAAVARFIAAMAAERGGRVLDAESHLRAASSEAGGWAFVEDRLAWYEADRGDAAAALGRWQAAGAPDGHPDVVLVRRFAAVRTGPDLGRNAPCWCGSGRKFKQCHRGKHEAAPLPERVGWLYRKAIAYVERRGGAAETAIQVHAAVRAGDDEDLDTGLTDPLTADVVLHEGGWLARFLEDRGPLLPADEALLGASWLLVDRTVYEVLDVEPGVGIGLRDLRTGERVDVAEKSASRTLTPGMLVCARAVPDGAGHQFVGAALPVEPGRERHLLDLLDDGDGLALLEWEAARTAPMRITGPDGAELVQCTARLQVGADAAGVLDEMYENSFGDDPGSWLSRDGDDRLLAMLDLDDDVLTVRTITEDRMDDALDELAAELPTYRVLSDERVRPDPDADIAPAAPPDIDPEQLTQIQDGFERRWCDEHVPALDGRTPREAAADPTRRDELVRLIATFPEIDPASGAFGMRPWRLRELLGLP